MTPETALAALIAWALTQIVARWLPDANRNAIPTIALSISTALVIAATAAFGAIDGDPLSWQTLRMGATVGAAAITGHYGTGRLIEGVHYVVEWLTTAKGKR